MIKPVEAKELAEVADVIRRSFLTVAEEFGFTVENAPRFTAFSVTAERLEYQLKTERRPMFAYHKDGAVAGYYSIKSCSDGMCELNNLCTAPEFRHGKIGSALLNHSFETAKNMGFVKMNISIVEENRRVKRWYEGFGFMSVETVKPDFFPFTCGYMSKDL